MCQVTWYSPLGQTRMHVTDRRYQSVTQALSACLVEAAEDLGLELVDRGFARCEDLASLCGQAHRVDPAVVRMADSAR